MSLGRCYILASQYNVIQIKVLGENQNARYSHVCNIIYYLNSFIHYFGVAKLKRAGGPKILAPTSSSTCTHQSTHVEMWRCALAERVRAAPLHLVRQTIKTIPISNTAIGHPLDYAGTPMGIR